MSFLLFSDLDATLLDEGTYSFEAAAPALELLRSLDVPLVPVTSKTRSEVEELRERLGNDDPFVVENGGGIYFPASGAVPAERARLHGDYYRVRLGADYARLRAFVQQLSGEFGLRGFGDMTDDEVARLTGLGRRAAQRARQREFSEPFLIEDEADLPELAEVARARGFALTRGGRFHQLVGAGQDKVEAVRIVTRTLAPTGHETRTIGLGDSANDRQMLEAVDIAVIVPRPDGSHLELSRRDAIVASQPGSKGWNEAVMEIVGPAGRDQAG